MPSGSCFPRRKSQSPCPLLLGEGAAAAAGVEGTPEILGMGTLNGTLYPGRFLFFEVMEQQNYISELEARIAVYSRLSQAMDDVQLGRTQDADSVFDDILKDLDGLEL